MCRSKTEFPPNGRRCFFHLYGLRIARMEATLERKENELAALYRMKTKPFEVRSRINELEETIARKRSRIEMLEIERSRKANPEDVETEIKHVSGEVKVLSNELEDLKSISVTPPAKRNRRIRDLNQLITKKQDELTALKEEAQTASETGEVEDTPADFDMESVNEAVLTRMYNEDSSIPQDFHLLLTPEERDWLETNRGEQPIHEFIHERLLTAPPVFPAMSVVAMLDTVKPKTKHDRSAARPSALADRKSGETAGRRPSVDKRVRSKGVTIAGEREGRFIYRYFTAQMADHYGLSMNQYARRRVLGIDLYSNEGDIGADKATSRLEKFAKVESRMYIPVTDAETGSYTVDVAELQQSRVAYDRVLQQEVFEKTVEKFGLSNVQAVFGPHLTEMGEDITGDLTSSAA